MESLQGNMRWLPIVAAVILQGEVEGQKRGEPVPTREQRAKHHTGRNMPFVCGSGRKFKKCCLGRAV